MDDRVTVRLGLLHLERQRRSLGRSAWAAARLRLTDVRLNTADARFAHDALVRFGRAIRISRARREHETGHELRPFDFGTAASYWRPGRVVKALLAAAALAALFAVLLMVGLPKAIPGGQSVAGDGGAAAGNARAAASPLRGRSQQFVAVLPVPTPVPTERPEPNATSGPAGGGVPGGIGTSNQGAGGTGSGSGTGSGAGNDDDKPTPTPKPTIMVLSITVTDAITRLGLPGVCITDGSTTCTNAPVTDQNGNAMMRLSIGQLWHLEFKRAGYATQQVDVTSDAASKAIAVALMPTR